MLIAWRDHRWNLKSDSIYVRWSKVTRYWSLGPIPPSWELMTKTTATKRSNYLSLFMYITRLTCTFSAFDELVVVSLKRWTQKNIENDLQYADSVAIFRWLRGRRTYLERLKSVSWDVLYVLHQLFVYRHHHLCSWSIV